MPTRGAARAAEETESMTTLPTARVSRIGQSGKVGWALLWLLGIPLPVLLIAYLIFHH